MEKSMKRYCVGMSSNRVNEIYYEANSINEIRGMIREDYPKYRIMESGEVHVFDRMPNTNEDGWYLLGYLSHRHKVVC